MIEITTLATGSKGNCYYITDGHTPLLLEAGIKFKEIQRKLNFQTRTIKGCLITHEHKDHCSGLQDVLKAGINTYLSPGTKDSIGIQHHRLNAVENKKQFTIGTWTVLPFDVQHDVSEPFGFLLVNTAGDKLLFATDTYYIKYRFQGLTHLMVECNYSQKILEENILSGRTPKILKKRLMQSHFSLENMKEFLKANDLSKIEEIWLLHLSDSNSNEKQFRKEVAELTGKMIYIP